MVSDTFTLADMRAAIAKLDELAVAPTHDGYYHVHIHPRQAAAMRQAAIDSRLRPARNFASWAAAAGENMRGWLRVGSTFEHLGGQSILDEDDVAEALERMAQVWKQIARRRRGRIKARKGWA